MGRTKGPGLNERRQQLRRRLSFLLEWIARLEGTALAQTKLQIDQVLEQLRLVEDRILAADPVAALLFAPPRPQLSEIQTALPNDDTLLLEFSLSEQRSFVFAVTKISLDVYALPSRADIESVARTVSEVLRRRENPRTALGRLSRMLLKPVESHLRKRPVLVVPDGALHYVPFSALPDPATGAPLIVDHEIVHLPSASALAILRANRKSRVPAPQKLLIVSDPVYDRGDSRLPTLARSGAKQSAFGRLIFSGRAAQHLAALVPPADRLMLVGFDADKKKLLSSSLRDYRVLHFDAHGVLDEAQPDLSGVVLSLVDREGSTRDGFLRLHDVTALDLRADLVVLGSCQSSLGREVRGEGLMALTRGFFYAGASAVVASLWNVDDEASAELMKHFYQSIFGSDRLRPAAALRRAQLATLARPGWRDPYYWASHTMQGLEVTLQ